MRVARFKEACPTSKLELWCEDEHRPGLKFVILRKVWSPVEKRPIVKVYQRYQRTAYLYALAARRPGRSTGRTCPG